ncbi:MULTISPECIES: helix-turn-helix domain-containing protein [Brevibacillus]|jgi:Transcriptional regulator containing an amidase domain and an AraC-type DNA-binding HTH domain|uniref:AraC family transcriptional regulator n=1 Tax=Brevibacillus parabrevis TaxID=54914 RepID=A0A4Y3P8D5_BREPA|nr:MULTISPECIES: AraC family transcriptional regulator [Brevibacillus]MBU8712849.1 AraC family transcriptional regulator [Brevibacillus parabrevis]MDH6348360.1 AraC-like DNA-binding protein [Brevibacillus sp. 1238]MDR5000498.1 AraC family transcriptional regulator [Brevibacillus parabrevis]MED2256542.1 AraC family transcriptional regulator [Brevibacillus parabrevis]NRQ52872.1 helix-turn-helix transcriptional regulator [Brevibacillus sp. HD1.4A]
MKDLVADMHVPCLAKCGFFRDDSPSPYSQAGTCFSISPEKGSGHYWTYSRENLFSISILDFVFYEDLYLEFEQPKYMSLNYYDSVAGEELHPPKRLSSGYIRVHFGCNNVYRARYEKNVPIRSTGFEITPEYYEDYLQTKYPDEYTDLRSAFVSVDGLTHFPELVFLLRQIRQFRGTGIAARLYYESKVAEAVSLIVERAKQQKKAHPSKFVSREDLDSLQAVTAYMDEHFAGELHLEHLARIACMGTTKLKYTFKLVYKCTITEYIQNKRMSHAEQLLSTTDLPISQIAQIVGYHNSSRFSELFRKMTGLLPNEYRRHCATPLLGVAKK